MLGQRVRFQDKRGTVRYVGPVSSSSSSSKKPPVVWLGVEWDHDREGLHDGTLFDLETNTRTQYFTCPPTRGSFVKQGKAQLPQGLAKAFALRYETAAAGEDSKLSVEVAHRGLSFDQMTVCSLADSALGTQEEEDGEALSLPRVQSVDVSSTLFETWDALLRVVHRGFPNARELIAADNDRLTAQEEEEAFGGGNTLETLVLTRANAHAVHALFSASSNWQGLRHLCLSGCALDRLPAGLPAQLQELDLSFNRFRSLPLLAAELSEKVPQLAVLNLSDNAALSIVLQDGDSSFTSPLTRLFVDNVTVDWRAMEALDRTFPALVELTLTLDAATDRKRALVRFPLLDKLNKSAISWEERHDAEIFCLRHEEAFPHRSEVQLKHGGDAAVRFAGAPAAGGGMVLVCVKFVPPAGGGEQQTRRLPRQTRLADLFVMYNRLFTRVVKHLRVTGSAAALSRVHCERDGLALEDVLGKKKSEEDEEEEEEECEIACF